MELSLAADNEVWRSGRKFILRSARVFGTGYNCYDSKPGDPVALKVNPPGSWFSTLEAAVAFFGTAPQSSEA